MQLFESTRHSECPVGTGLVSLSSPADSVGAVGAAAGSFASFTGATSSAFCTPVTFPVRFIGNTAGGSLALGAGAIAEGKPLEPHAKLSATPTSSLNARLTRGTLAVYQHGPCESE